MFRFGDLNITFCGLVISGCWRSFLKFWGDVYIIGTFHQRLRSPSFWCPGCSWNGIALDQHLRRCGCTITMKWRAYIIHPWNIAVKSWPSTGTLATKVAFAADFGSDLAKDTDTFQHLYLGVGALGLSLIFHPNLLLGMVLTAGLYSSRVETQDTPNSPTLVCSIFIQFSCIFQSKICLTQSLRSYMILSYPFEKKSSPVRSQRVFHPQVITHDLWLRFQPASNCGSVSGSVIGWTPQKTSPKSTILQMISSVNTFNTSFLYGIKYPPNHRK